MMDWIGAFFLVFGAAVCLVAAIGVLRFPDFFMRMHAATKAGVAGAGLVLIGIGFAAPSLEIAIKIALANLFLLLTIPVAGHLLGRAGYVAGVPLWGATQRDELSGVLSRGVFDRPVKNAGDAAKPGQHAAD
ncbi:monovalent cation/H(+) antiporter subunit G [Hyphomicrobium sp.]|uniref:monovalent cation/H(+) antiporter subunit G n=1 Tax=Hyphomicrobium sp. TaxID=82 RepID=UPI002C08D2A5|nr:monovalent cation/H(+) antiporter subunit G [Hyphomicrobium sp.]HRN89434.1 monovalent cation/H(+) antiporter subunit G [Hyphomicrobium sp.]HRQ27860.1 monovalent cation/H(+) antiporter subunit G [Hyphomicrobium sp.]